MRSNVFGDARFWYCPNLIKFAHILITFAQISPKFDQILPKFAQALPKKTPWECGCIPSFYGTDWCHIKVDDLEEMKNLWSFITKT